MEEIDYILFGSVDEDTRMRSTYEISNTVCIREKQKSVVGGSYHIWNIRINGSKSQVFF